MIKKVLIANRGEIACRVIRTAKKLNIKTIAVYSDVDKSALHVQMADEAYPLHGNTSKETYLDQEKILNIAKLAHADAIHPGYGFLAENAEFAELAHNNKIVFMGPSSKVIRDMGLKSAAKVIVEKLNIPLLPGYHGDNQDGQFLKQQAEKIGFPVLLKAIAGGGGRGMRVVNSADEFAAQLASAKRESSASFGNDKILIEKYLTSPRHIEVQICGDNFGNVVHFFERDCSIQRRHQKIIEEAPAVHLPETLRAEITAASVAIGRAIHYSGVGTIEYLVDNNAKFYFMEMNTRLQVEHPITEMITGVDLVEWQFQVANNEKLPLAQDQIKAHGHAIEARLCAEDPQHDYRPATGKLQLFMAPQPSEHVRIDTGVQTGNQISMYYDSLIAKILVWSETRAKAVELMQSTLAETLVAGVATNRDFLQAIVAQPDYLKGNINTQFIPKHLNALQQSKTFPAETIIPLAALFVLNQAPTKNQFNYDSDDIYSPWQKADFKTQTLRWLRFYQAEKCWLIIAESQAEQTVLTGECLPKPVHAKNCHYDAITKLFSVTIGAKNYQCIIVTDGQNLHLFVGAEHYQLSLMAPARASASTEDSKQIYAPLSGIVAAVNVKAGDNVQRGQTVIVLEAMKMEHALNAPSSGVVEAIRYNVGDQVKEGMELLQLR